MKLKKEVSLTLGQKLIDTLIHFKYAFAVWRMPNTSEICLIISLNGVKKTKKISLTNSPSGFVFNSYQSNHPISPYFITADVILKKGITNVSSSVKEVDIATLLENLQLEYPNSFYRHEKLDKLDSFSNVFETQITEAIHCIKEKFFDKVVLSRYKDEFLPPNFSTWEFFKKITDSYHNAFCSLCYFPEKGLWIGASPEILISNNSERFLTVSIAGTKALADTRDLSEIAWTQKEIEEQAFVSRYIINCFKKLRLRKFHEYGPKTIQAGHLAHLKTEFRVNHDEIYFDSLAEQMLELLHPTSAVCGMPIEKVKPWIEKTEAYNREFYSGFLGPINFEESTNLFVNLRCLKIVENKVRFYAGAGITEDSLPAKEFEETEIKMDVLKSLIY